MRNLAAVRDDDLNRPKGIQRTRCLPDPALGALWDSIILDDALKSQLLSQAVLNFTLRGKVDRSVLSCPLLSGPSTVLVWTMKEKQNAIEEAQAGGDHRQTA